MNPTTGTLASGLFPELLIDWGLVFTDAATANPSNGPAKSSA